MPQRSSKWKPTLEAVPPVESISEDEKSYHVKVMHDRAAAHETVRLMDAIAGAWWTHLKERYGLQDADTVNLDGLITRVPPGDAPPAPIPAPDESEG